MLLIKPVWSIAERVTFHLQARQNEATILLLGAAQKTHAIFRALVGCISETEQRSALAYNCFRNWLYLI